jgi:hypothetical protein
VFQATEAIGGLAERLIRTNRLKRDCPIALSTLNLQHGERQGIGFPMACSEVRLVTGLSEPNSAALTRWCIQAAQYKKALFPGLATEPISEDAVRLIWTELSVIDLHQRWAEAVALVAVGTAG